jgi:Serine hydrolase (FSH1)
MEGPKEKKMKILCLHGFRTSGSFLKKQISKWDPSIFEEFDMVAFSFYSTCVVSSSRSLP